ncbi:uncharacterized protein LOC109544392 [Dendroctonus ponderosae]|uniref:Uncharacterized protein n=1 Tax=Dendroctonus ponderosae TaxID=77166 RepID=A0AAR5QA36_DENPD|nr:uncharacterized protein LOC109544392 [Dendroctonus ponderosae]KAH1009060.1 hypothetical protein HUJ04_001486 [Dendroctonus ponderosae]KAH1009061.1 hypothetical protein HUJ04_001486 [Dendroctonus ponderosae]KAH1017021.1 hypothetical protein HUJ05_007756 [Dendroctonus ponderosae]KAH1017022.1 hypothetical protein HUJ05_007756 [Dendroctonus ponderosae]
MSDKLFDEMYIVSSDAERQFGDQKNIFYDRESDASHSVKSALRAFDRDNGNLSSYYQEKVIPKLTDRSHNFFKWLIDSELLSANVACPNSKHDQNCLNKMELVIANGLYDSYQLRCKNCCRRESIRKHSIFYGIKCNLRSAIRILYGWCKGMDLEIMSNILGLDKHIIGTMYNRTTKVVNNCLRLLRNLGGNNVVVLIDIYPHLMSNQRALIKSSRPILCITQISGIPQKYWLEALDYWDPNNSADVTKITNQVHSIISSRVHPESTLVLPINSTLSFTHLAAKLKDQYCKVRCLDDLTKCSSSSEVLSSVLETIWNVPLAICEEAQYFNPDYVGQFLTKHIWNKVYEEDSFVELIGLIANETKRNEIDYCLNV